MSWTCQSSIANRRPIPPRQPWLDDRLSITTAVRLASPMLPASTTASELLPLVVLGIPDQAVDPAGQLLGAQPEGDPDRGRQSVAERAAGELHPGDQGVIGMVTEGGVEAA